MALVESARSIWTQQTSSERHTCMLSDNKELHWFWLLFVEAGPPYENNVWTKAKAFSGSWKTSYHCRSHDVSRSLDGERTDSFCGDWRAREFGSGCSSPRSHILVCVLSSLFTRSVQPSS